MIGPDIPAGLLSTNRSVSSEDEEEGPAPPPTTGPSVGPSIPTHLLSGTVDRSTTPEDEDVEAEGPPRPTIGPSIPSIVPAQPSGPAFPQDEEDEEEEDDYTPALPPKLLASRSASKRVHGPSFPPSAAQGFGGEDSDEDVGPMPLPAGFSLPETDAVSEFLEKEERRRKHVEDAEKPKALKRDEWMLAPPSSSDLLSKIDPTKMNKPRQFSRTAKQSRDVDSSLLRETPAERQQRLEDEVAGKRRRAVNADPDAPADEEAELEARKRRRRDEEIRRGVDEHTRKSRGAALLDQHDGSTSSKSRKGKEEEAPPPPGVWEHGRDMALSGRLMDDKTRDKYIKDARGLGDRFGSGRSGGFL